MPRQSDKLQGNIATKVGADEIVYPESETGIRMAEEPCSRRKVYGYCRNILDTFSIIEPKVPESWVGKESNGVKP
ncbi:MAG: hypothetical protein ACLRR3_03885 [Eubacterium sp.]